MLVLPGCWQAVEVPCCESVPTSLSIEERVHAQSKSLSSVLLPGQAELNPHAVEDATEPQRSALKVQRLQLAGLQRELTAAQAALQQQVAKREALLLKVRPCHTLKQRQVRRLSDCY